MNQIKTKIVLFTVAIICVFLTLTFSNTRSRQPASPKTVTELIVSPFSRPNPYRLNNVAVYHFVHQIGEFLVRRDNYQNIVGGLAHSWTISANRKQIVFHLRPGLYTAPEVAQSLKRLISVGQTSHSNLAHQVASPDDIHVIDDLNVAINTTGDAGAMLAPLVMADTVILPDSHWTTVPGESDLAVDWTKTKGPYVYISGNFADPASEPIRFKPNPNHYNYAENQLDWKIVYHPITKIRDLATLKELIDKEPTFMTARYWDLLSLFSTQDPGLRYYETRQNGINFLVPNVKSKLFSSVEGRLSFSKHILNSKIPMLNPSHRANEIAQPGLTGRLPEEELKTVLKTIESTPDQNINIPITWSIPVGPGANSSWVKSIAEASGLPYHFKDGGFLKIDRDWQDQGYDVILRGVSMSDTDPISSATYLFSPTAGNADFPDGRILKLLNSAKDTVDRNVIAGTVRKAFRMALEGGTIIPINYICNRHYYRADVELNIQDPYAESIFIWDVRLKN